MAFGMDRLKGALTFCDAFPAMNSPAVFSALERMHTDAHAATRNRVNASLGCQGSVTRLEKSLRIVHPGLLSSSRGEIKKHLVLLYTLFSF